MTSRALFTPESTKKALNQSLIEFDAVQLRGNAIKVLFVLRFICIHTKTNIKMCFEASAPEKAIFEFS
jgi:hypothetical protein